MIDLNYKNNKLSDNKLDKANKDNKKIDKKFKKNNKLNENNKINKINKITNNQKQFLILVLIIIILLSILFIFFPKMNYKNFNSGHNMSNKNIEDIEEYILNISSYIATIEVTVNSNKTTNKYIIKQEYNENKIKQTIIEPENINGMEMTYENNTLTINNSKLNLSKTYENYEYITDNSLDLQTFIKEYKNEKEQNNQNTNYYEENGIYIFEVKIENSDNQYIKNKKLKIDKSTGKPRELVIEDINKKTAVYILYNEIEIN